MSDIPVDLALIRGAAQRLGVAIPEMLEVDTRPEAAVVVFATVRDLRKALADLEAWLEAEVVVRVPFGQHRIGEHLVEVRGGATKRGVWRHDDLAWAVCKDIAVDTATGEVVREVADVIDKVRSRLFQCMASPSYWRANVLRDLGIDPDNYAQRVPSRRTAQILPAVTEAAPEGQVAS